MTAETDQPDRIVHRHFRHDDAVEQVGCDGLIGEGGDRFTWLGQIGVGLRVEHRPGRASSRHPFGELLVGNGIGLEDHVGKTIAAELRRESRVASRSVGLQLKMRRHSGHRVDLAAELRHEEAVHDAGRRKIQADRHTDRDDQTIDAGNALVGIDEQPFPIEETTCTLSGGTSVLIGRRGSRS